MPKVPGAGTNQELAARSSPTWQNLSCRCSGLAAWEGVGWGAWPWPRTLLSLLLRCLPLPARCWEPTGSTGAGAVHPLAGVSTPHLLSAPGGIEGPHLPGLGQCHLPGEHAGAGKLQEGDTGGAGETSCPLSAPSRDSPWHCQAGTALPQECHEWRGWRSWL